MVKKEMVKEIIQSFVLSGLLVICYTFWELWTDCDVRKLQKSKEVKE